MAKKKVISPSPDDTSQTTIFLIVIFVLIGAFYFYNCFVKNKKISESFGNQKQTCPVYNPIGPYDGIVLPPSGDVYNLMQPTRQNATVLGYQVPLQQPNPNSEVGYSETYPTVDGTPNTPKDLFMFAHNMSHPDCCPSTYSTSTGCICTTPEQRNWIFMRGKK